MNLKEVKHEKCTRKSFSKIGDFVEMPNLIQVQKDSYNWFIEEGLGEVLKDISPIVDYSGNLVLEFLDYHMEEKTKYTMEEAKERDATYSTRLHVKVRLINKETGEIKEQEIYLGDFPVMTDSATFIINGAERVIVSQLVRSPSCYYAQDYDKTGKRIYTSTVMPIRGAWLEYETDGNDIFYVRVDRTRKLPVTSLLRSIGFVTDEQILDLFANDPKIKATLDKDTIKTQDEAIIEIYKKLRPGELPTADAARNLFDGLFFDNRRYDLAKVGRYKFNKKLCLATRITGQVAYDDIVDPSTGEVLAEKNTRITAEAAEAIQDSGINIVDILVEDKTIRIIGNGIVDIHKVLPTVDFSTLNIKEKVNYQVLKNIIDNTDEKDLPKTVEERMDELVPKHITTEDIIASVNYLLNLSHGLGKPDDIDHLANRRIRCVGELLQNQFRIGLTRLERVVRERMTIQDLDSVTPQTLINTKPMNDKEVIYRLIENGYIPIIAHPERYPFVQENPDYLFELEEMGALFQANFGSIIGMYGGKAKKTLKILLKNNLISFLGSDVHKPEQVYNKIPKIIKKLKKVISDEEFIEFTEINPQKVLNNEDIIK